MIRRQRVMRYITSDGKSFDTHSDAIAHEKYLVVLQRVDYLMRCGVGAEAFAKAILDTPGLIIALAPATVDGGQA